MGDSEQILPIVVAVRFVKRTYLILIVFAAAGLGVGFWKSRSAKTTYHASMTVESDVVDKNVMVKLVGDLKPEHLRAHIADEAIDVDHLSLSAAVVDIKDRVVTEKTEPSKMCEISVTMSKPDGYETVSRGIVSTLTNHPYVQERLEEGAGVPIRTVNGLTEPSAQNPGKRLFIQFLVLFLVLGIVVAIIYDLAKSTYRHMRDQ